MTSRSDARRGVVFFLVGLALTTAALDALAVANGWVLLSVCLAFKVLEMARTWYPMPGRGEPPAPHLAAAFVLEVQGGRLDGREARAWVALTPAPTEEERTLLTNEYEVRAERGKFVLSPKGQGWLK